MYSGYQREVREYNNRMRLEVGTKFLAATLRVSAACSRPVYWVSASDKDLLTKNIGLYSQYSSSLNKVVLIETSEIVM